MIQVHRLKTWPAYFADIRAKIKNFEIRENDRDYKVGDVLILQEYDLNSQSYSGREEVRTIIYMTNYGQMTNHVVLGLSVT